MKNNNKKIVDFFISYNENNENTTQKIYLNVPYPEKDIARNLGARFDGYRKKWYFTNLNDTQKFKKWLKNRILTYDDLSEEQQALVKLVKEGKNVLVNACIGSGKTSTIQVLCNELQEKKILYLTYNRLLKVDAKCKIQNPNAVVTNYHGFATFVITENKFDISGVSDLIQAYIGYFDVFQTHPSFDLLLIDEYQDINEEISHMLELIKLSNPGIQIVAVGDMDQKIYDKTRLDILDFMNQFLENHESLNFTKCFRLNAEFASRLGKIWNKTIIGVNNECEVKVMSFEQIKLFLEKQEPSDILCIGSRLGIQPNLLNILEEQHPNKFNKNTVYSSINNENRAARILTDNSTALFTTYDSCKGLERKVCVIFDFSIEYWTLRSNQNNIRYEILRNIFCVAASRGKSHIIFADIPKYHLLTDKILSTRYIHDFDYNQPFLISEMFDYLYKEDIEECFSLLEIEKDETAEISEINFEYNSGMIDLSYCIEKLQIASFFDNFSIDEYIDFYIEYKDIKNPPKLSENASIEEKILYYTALVTNQDRYIKQVPIPFINKNDLELLHERMSEKFDKNDTIQVRCDIKFLNNGHEQNCAGYCDVLKDDMVWQIFFIPKVEHDHFLKCACYMIALSKAKGVVWNIRTNERFFITIPDPKKFMEAVIKTITKGKASNVTLFIDQ